MRKLKKADKDALGLLGFAAATVFVVAFVAPMIRRERVQSTITVGPPTIG